MTKPNKPKSTPQDYCIPFEAAMGQMAVLNQKGLLVKYFKIIVVGDDGGKVTLTFDPVKFHKNKQTP